MATYDNKGVGMGSGNIRASSRYALTMWSGEHKVVTEVTGRTMRTSGLYSYLLYRDIESPVGPETVHGTEKH